MFGSTIERSQTLYSALALAILAAAFIIAKTGRNTLFFHGKGIFQLPLAVLFVRAMKSWGTRPARIGLMLLAAIVIGVAAPFLKAGDSALLFNIFIFIPGIFGMFASLWLFASDIFGTTAKSASARAFSKLGASSLAGGMAGGFIAKGLLPLLEPQWLIFCGALLTLVVVGIVIRAHQLFPSNIASKKDSNDKSSSYFAPLWKPYALTLLCISITGALAGLLIDVQFYISATTASMGTKGNASLFANFYIMLNFSSLLLQLFVTPRIQDKIGVGGGLMVLPLALVGGVGARIAEAIGAVPLYLWARQVAPGGVVTQPLDTRWMAWLTLATVLVWLMITRKFRRQTQDEQTSPSPVWVPDIDCERFPDQCPCTTELGKGIA